MEILKTIEESKIQDALVSYYYFYSFIFENLGRINQLFKYSNKSGWFHSGGAEKNLPGKYFFSLLVLKTKGITFHKSYQINGWSGLFVCHLTTNPNIFCWISDLQEFKTLFVDYFILSWQPLKGNRPSNLLSTWMPQ